MASHSILCCKFTRNILQLNYPVRCNVGIGIIEYIYIYIYSVFLLIIFKWKILREYMTTQNEITLSKLKFIQENENELYKKKPNNNTIKLEDLYWAFIFYAVYFCCCAYNRFLISNAQGLLHFQKLIAKQHWTTATRCVTWCLIWWLKCLKAVSSFSKCKHRRTILNVLWNGIQQQQFSFFHLITYAR